MTGFYRFALNLTVLLRLLIYRVRYTGRENLPPEGGWIVACNHRSFVDPVLLAQGIPRQVFYMGKAEIFKVPVLGKIVSWLGVFPVSRGTGDTSAVDHAVEKLRQGGLLGIFPEGTRSSGEAPGRFKSGMAHIAKSAGVGIIPCAVIFKGKMGFGKKIEIRYGKPIPHQELFDGDQSSAALKRATKLVAGRITAMLDLPTLPETKD